MVSYWKTQWLDILLGSVDIGLSIYHFCINDQLWGIAWMPIAVVWFMMSFINYNADRIDLLEKKQERNDAMFELVQELVKANKLYEKIMKKYEESPEKLEDRSDD